MSKYIDADLLKERLDTKYKEFTEKAKKDCPLQYQYMADGLDIAEQFVDSLQQEQPDFPTTDEQVKDFLATHPKVEVPEKYKTPDFVFEQEQPRVNLEKEIEIFTTRLYHETFGNGQGTLDEFDWEDIATVIEETARHFYELGLRRAAEMCDEIEYNRQRAEEENK